MAQRKVPKTKHLEGITLKIGDGDPVPIGNFRFEFHPRGNVFALDGTTWMIVFGDELLRLEDSKGLKYVQILLQHQGKELELTELCEAVNQPSSDDCCRAPADADTEQAGRTGPSVSGLGDAGEVLDQKAEAEYRERLRQLSEMREQAEQIGDHQALEKIDKETKSIKKELSAAIGLHGRRRKAANTFERQRKAVQKCIAEAIAQVLAANPALGEHLKHAIRTGVVCVYRPKAPVDWSFDPEPPSNFF
jgi:hypothetical protein